MKRAKRLTRRQLRRIIREVASDQDQQYGQQSLQEFFGPFKKKAPAWYTNNTVLEKIGQEVMDLVKDTTGLRGDDFELIKKGSWEWSNIADQAKGDDRDAKALASHIKVLKLQNGTIYPSTTEGGKGVLFNMEAWSPSMKSKGKKFEDASAPVLTTSLRGMGKFEDDEALAEYMSNKLDIEFPKYLRIRFMADGHVDEMGYDVYYAKIYIFIQ